MGKDRENVILFLQSIQKIQKSNRSSEDVPMNGTNTASSVFCTSCGAPLQIGHRFCGKCGAPEIGTANPTLTTHPAPVVPCRATIAPVTYAGLPSYYQREFSMIESSKEQYKGRWNWAAFFFGALWALTKGLWVSALVAFVGAIFTYGIVGVIYWWIFAIRGNYMYYRKIARNENPAY
jgi:hypothetical protein